MSTKLSCVRCSLQFEASSVYINNGPIPFCQACVFHFGGSDCKGNITAGKGSLIDLRWQQERANQPHEIRCGTCQRKNDSNVRACWWCGNSPSAQMKKQEEENAWA